MRSTLLHGNKIDELVKHQFVKDLKKYCEINTNDHPHNPNPKTPHSKGSSDGP